MLPLEARKRLLRRLKALLIVCDAWEEGDHPRRNDGKFGTGSGKSSGGGGVNNEEIQGKIASVKIDFDKDNILPGLNAQTLQALGKPDKPVMLKKSIIDKNKGNHPEISESDFGKIIGQSLYNPEIVVPGNPKKPYFNFISRVGKDKNTITLLEMSETKSHYEIVNFHWAGNRQRKQKERGI
jgi:hypothetical protein